MSDVIYNISSGFFDSVNGDRLYSAADMNKPYKRVIADGIFPTPQGTPSTDFQVVAVSGMSVAVLAGNAMIGARWAENTDDVGITIAGNSSSSPRIDSIFLHIDTGMDTRAAGVVYRQGTAAGTPTAPAMVQTDNITELRLADILVAPSASIITQANITDQRGGSDCPWVAGLIQQVDTSALFEQYRAAYAEQQQDQADEWNTFMSHLARDYDISMSLRKHESTYTSTAAASLIPINIDGYDTTKDLLQVYINGIFAVEGTHYIVKSAAQIQLTNAISAGQKVHFVIYKAVMGGAQPIIPTDEQVQDAVDAYMDAHPGALVVDPELSDTSTHAIQNKAVAEAFAGVNGRLGELEDAVGGEVEITATFTNGRSIAPSTGTTNAHTISSYSSWIPCEEGDEFLLTMPLYTSVNYRGLAFYSAQGSTDAAIRAAYISGIQCNYNASLSDVSFETRRIVAPEGAHFFRTTWFASTETLYSDFSCVKVKEGTISTEISGVQADLDDVKVAGSGNALDHSTLQSGYAISASGVVSENGSYATTDYIPVREGDVVVLGDGKAHSISIARLCTYNSAKEFISGATANVSSFTVPAGVAFIRLCANNTYLSKPTGRVNLAGVLEPYEDYYSGNVNRIAQKNGTSIFSLLHYPLSTLPDCIVKNLAYKPLGELSKGYICLTTDDGGAGVASYTIPMCIDKDVPFTFAMMSDSAVLQTAEGLTTVKDAVENHGCCIAQHGGTQWTNYDEYGLSAFFDTEKAYWDSVEIPVYGACAPQIQINDWILALAGGRFGCHRGAYQYSAPYYGAYINGPRSNLYNLTSQNIIDSDLGTWKAKCDVTLSNHWLMFIHTHENELTADAKTKLEGVIDYAKQIGLTFVTMKDIPTLI